MTLFEEREEIERQISELEKRLQEINMKLGNTDGWRVQIA